MKSNAPVLIATIAAPSLAAKLAAGPIALQWGRATIKFRKVEIRPL